MPNDTRLIVPEGVMEVLKTFRTSGDYATDVANDFAQMEPHFPEKVDTILDIGCGLAGLDVLLRRKYPKARVMLLDKEVGVPYYNFEQGMAPYGNRAAAEELLLANGVHDAEWIEGSGELEADLIVSTLAWGFHFPLSTYKVRGFCIADLRRGKEEPRGKVIAESNSYLRCAWQC